jgi:NAD(P)-dependent dehydrogenase (short-subunit alcohol dehydrogenase family)
MRDIFNVKGKTVCIIGGTGLIGSRLVKVFSEGGARVFAGSRSACKKRAKRHNVQYLPIDIRYTDSIKKFISYVTHEAKKIDIWINCALPRVDGTSGKFEEIDSVLIAKETENHLIGFYRCCQEVFRHMKKNRCGNIINFGSIYGELSPDFRIYKNTEIVKSPAYSIVEGGINTLTRYLACYGAKYNIRVNAVCPGGVRDKHSSLFQRQYSDRVPMARMAYPEEIAGPVIFLASKASSYVTGHILNVDGGIHAW